MSQPAIQIHNLHKRFGNTLAVRGISFEVEPGTIFSLLGPNGAGKSTTISMIACLLRPDEGEAYVMGHSVLREPQQVKASLGIVPQELALYEDLTARENLEFWGKMYGLRGSLLQQRVDNVLAMTGLADRQKERVEAYSGGMKRRVNIGIALLHRPDVIIMDEPTVGIDPQSRRHILDGVLDFNRAGSTILYTTHYMEEAQELSDRIAIMDHGAIIAAGTQEELVHIVGERDRIALKLNHEAPEVVAAWGQVEGVSHISADPTPDHFAYEILAQDSNNVLPHLFDVAAGGGVRIVSIDIQEPNLETVFLHLTGRALRD